MNLGRLQALAMVAKHGSVARAAEVLHVTPSVVSQQLNKLARETGRPLLEPVGRGVRLTRAGQLLAEHAGRVLAQVAAAEADLATLDQEVAGPLRIGSVGSAIRALLPDVLAELVAEHPRLAVTLCDGEVVDLLLRLLTDELTVLLIESWEARPPAPARRRRRAHPRTGTGRSRTRRGSPARPSVLCGPRRPRRAAVVLLPGGHRSQRDAHADHAGPRTRPVLNREIRAAWRRDDQSPPVRTLLASLASRQEAVNRTGSAR